MLKEYHRKEVFLSKKQMLIILFAVVPFLSFSQKSDTLSERKVKPVGEYKKFRIGGYGEMLYQRMDYGPDRYNYENGSQPDKRAIIDIPRMIIALEYKFNPKIEFSTEIEFEHGGAGSAMEIEYEEFGEYEAEIEKGGEVVLEQMHLTYSFSDALRLRAGHIIVPVGGTNANHLPINFFGTIRPEGENTIIPLTWHETGLAVLGDIKRWHYQVMIVNGLDANGFSSPEWIRTGRQKVFEQMKATNMALAGRVENKSIRGLNLGLSFYIGNSAANTAKPKKMDHINGTVAIGSFNFKYMSKNLIAKGNLLYGNLSDSDEITRINRGLSKMSPYPRTPVAKNAATYSFEAGYNIFKFFGSTQKLYPFFRYEYYNAMENTEELVFADSRFKRELFTAGVNYFLLPNLVLKADFSKRIIDKGNYNTENTFGLAIAYTGWFFQK